MDLGKFAYDNLVAGGPIHTKDVNVKAGQGVLKRGTILGKVKNSVGSASLAGTGNGTCTLIKTRKSAVPGTYTATAVSLAATAVTFDVANGAGKNLGSCTVGLGTSDVADFNSDEIAFRITNGSTDFDATSVFSIVVTEGVPNTGSATMSGSANGTCVNVRGAANTKVGAYIATCVEKITNSGKFEVKNPDGIVIGYVYARNYVGTGTGAITQLTAGKNKKDGLYTVICTVAATNGGTFQVKDPDGNVIGTVVLPGTSTGSVVFVSDEISFKIADATDFIVGDVFKLDILNSEELILEIVDGTNDFDLTDYFTVTTTIGEKDCKAHDYANTDGSQYPYAILAEDIDATSADIPATAISAGQVVERELVFSTADYDAVQRIRDDLRSIGIEVVGSVRRDPV